MKKRRWAVRAVCALLVGASVAPLVSCSDDVLTGQPSWLGNSIYERLQEDGNYTTVLRLIDDLDQREVLAHTGSKTLFVASDSAYREWYKGNDWGVSRYEQLSTAQKKLLLNNSMINNAYLIELMSNVAGTPPVEGMAMRRETATSLFDSIYIMPPAEMPGTKGWEELKSRGKKVPIMKDATTPPMIHFLPAYMTFNKITSEDLSILTNGQATSANEAWVNGKKVVERDLTCKNGYVQKVDGVIESSPNMAEILRQHPQMSRWSQLVDRFSAPYYNATATREYNRIYNNEDSVFSMRYYSKRSVGGAPLTTLPDNTTQAPAQLSFDPGWNHYMYANTMGYDLHYDAGAMIVPTNKALEEWWNGDGRDLQDEYKEWDSIPDATLAKLINVNMLDVFSETVPSKFGTILNDAKDVLGITKADVDSCFMGCNGVVYLVNKVFTPAEYSSVAYPALAHESTMNTIYWALSGADGAISELNFLPYLLSMQSTYALLLPSNEAMKNYIDPASYGNMQGDSLEAPQQIEFRYDKTKTISNRVQASRFNTTVDADGNITQGIRAQETVASNVYQKMLADLVDQLIIVIPEKGMSLEKYVERGYSFFKTKGGTLLRVTRGSNGNLAFEGGWQIEHNGKKLEATEVFEKSNGNGRSYLLDTQMPLGSQKSLYMTLQEHPEYNAFLQMLTYGKLLSLKLNNKYNPANVKNGNQNMRLFDNYNYTVFVPSTEAITKLQNPLAQGETMTMEKKNNQFLPTWDLMDKEFADGKAVHVDEDKHVEYTSVIDSLCYAEGWYNRFARSASDTEEREAIQLHVDTCLQNIMADFVRYHVMDRSVAIGMAPEAGMTDNSYESMKRNTQTGRFYPLLVNNDDKIITVTDAMGNTQQVKMREGLCNNICREYWFEGTGNQARLFMGSDAVVHLIDQPLYYETMRPWREVVEDYLKSKL